MGSHEQGRTEKYQAFKKDVMPIIKEIQASGVKSLQGIADALSDREIKLGMAKIFGIHHKLKIY